MKNFKKGFTLIELLVVVAIIGILASVVLASLNSARSKGNDAKVKAQLSSVRAAAEIFYSTNNSYGATTATDICHQTTGDAAGLYNLLLAANYPTGATPVCNTDATTTTAATKWAASADLATTGSYWCVDSTGTSKATASALSSNTVCGS